MNIQKYIESSQSNFAAINIVLGDSQACIPIEVIVNKWTWANIYVMKQQWDDSVEIPYKIQSIKSLGELANQIFLLCERTHTFDENNMFPNAANWFHRCLVEMCVLECNTTLYETIKPIQSSWKKGFISWHRNQLNLMKNNKNPYNKECVGLSTLIEKSIKLKNQSSKFYRNYWKEFLKKYSLFISDLETNSKITYRYIEENKYYIQKGKGKSYASKICCGEIYKYPEIPVSLKGISDKG